MRTPLLIGGGILVFFILVGLLANMFSTDTTTISQRLLYRVNSLSALATSANSTIQSDSLSKINAEFSSVLTSDITALGKVIPTAKTTKELTTIKTEEADAATTAKLATAKINGQYDSTYKTVLMQKIEATNALVTELWSKSSSSSVKTALTTLNSHLKVYYAELKTLP
jgi:hypothetical protein